MSLGATIAALVSKPTTTTSTASKPASAPAVKPTAVAIAKPVLAAPAVKLPVARTIVTAPSPITKTPTVTAAALTTPTAPSKASIADLLSPPKAPVTVPVEAKVAPAPLETVKGVLSGAAKTVAELLTPTRAAGELVTPAREITSPLTPAKSAAPTYELTTPGVLETMASLLKAPAPSRPSPSPRPPPPTIKGGALTGKAGSDMASVTYVIDPRTGRRVAVRRRSEVTRKSTARPPAKSAPARSSAASSLVSGLLKLGAKSAPRRDSALVVGAARTPMRGSSGSSGSGGRAGGRMVVVGGKTGMSASGAPAARRVSPKTSLAIARASSLRTPSGTSQLPLLRTPSLESKTPMTSAAMTPAMSVDLSKLSLKPSIDQSKLQSVMPATPAAQQPGNWDKLFAMLGTGAMPQQTGFGGGGGSGGGSGSGGDGPTASSGEPGYPGGEDDMEPSDELDIFASGEQEKPDEAPGDAIEPANEAEAEPEDEIDIEAEPEEEIDIEAEPEVEAPVDESMLAVAKAQRAGKLMKRRAMREAGMGVLPATLPPAPVAVPAPAPVPQATSTGTKVVRAAACFGLGFLIGAVLFGDD